MTCATCGLFDRQPGLVVCRTCLAVRLEDVWDQVCDPTVQATCTECGRVETSREEVLAGAEAVALYSVTDEDGWWCEDCLGAGADEEDEDEGWKVA